jgi:hypothetical protein
MTAQELFNLLEQAIRDGHGNAPIYFDTEAKVWDYHMAKVGKAYCEDFGGQGNFWITLHEEDIK